MLGQRLITGALLAAAFGGALLWLPTMAMVYLTAGVVLLGAWEWSGLAGLGGGARAGYVLLLAAVLAGCLRFWPAAAPALLLAAGCWWLLMLRWVLDYPHSVRWWGSAAATAAMGVLVLVPAWAAVYWLLARDRGELWLAAVVVLTASADIGAFFGGRAFGRRRLAPAVSPGKTWEGACCGMALALAIGVLLVGPLGMGGQWVLWLPVVAFTVCAGVLGDLGESMVKRHHGVKDSGSLLPGHGGVLDRIDSLSAALPVFALGLALAERVAGLRM